MIFQRLKKWLAQKILYLSDVQLIIIAIRHIF